jgi:hypothetical protein
VLIRDFKERRSTKDLQQLCNAVSHELQFPSLHSSVNAVSTLLFVIPRVKAFVVIYLYVFLG